jgi:hypothetical protein
MNNVLKIFAWVLLLWSAPAMAQRDSSLVQQAEFNGELKIHLRDAGKIASHPSIIEQKSTVDKLKFSFLPTPPVSTKDPDKIPASKINVVDKLPNLQNGYLKVGLGNYMTPLVDGYFSSGRSKKGDVGGEVHHLSSNGGVVPDSANVKSAYSETTAGVFGRYFFKKASIQGVARYQRNVVGFYGNQSLIQSSEMDSAQSALFALGGTQQKWQDISADLEYKSFSRDSSDMNYHARGAYRYGWGALEERESVVDVQLGGDKLLNNEVFALDFGFQSAQFHSKGYGYNGLGAFKDSRDTLWRARSQSNTIFRLQPSAYTVWKDVRVRVGMGVYYDVKGEKPAHFYPLLELKWSILDGLFLPYAGVRGGVELNTFHQMFEQNPFVLSNPLLLNRNNKMEVYGGLNGVISSNMGYELGVNWHQFENQVFFVNDSSASLGNRFIALYDNMSMLKMHGKWMWKAMESLSVEAGVEFYQYQVKNALYAWNMPNWKGNLKAQYRLGSQWNIGADVYYIGARKAYSFAPVNGQVIQQDAWKDRPGYVVDLKQFVDVSLQVNYQYNKQISAWASVYNTVAQQYQIWNAYPQQRLLFMMGAKLSF